jgi:hypothetical protein
LSPRTIHVWFVESWMHAPSLMSHGVGFTTGAGGGGGGGGVSEEEGAADDEDGTPEDGTPEDGTPEDGTPEDGAEDNEGGGAVGVSACTAPCAHPATDINATATSSIRIAHPPQ